MTTREDIDQILAEVGPLLEPEAIEASPDDPAWAIAINETTLVELELDAARDVLILSTDLGPAVDGDLLTLYRLMLNYAGIWHATSGLRLGLGTEADEFVLLQDISASGLTPQGVAERISDFVQRSDAWRDILATPCKAPDDGAAVSLSGLPGMLA